MTVRQAERALKARLVFGNLQQIAAVRFLADVEAAEQAIRVCECKGATCRTCKGRGSVDTTNSDGKWAVRECISCDGVGWLIAGCNCLDKLPSDVRASANRQAKSLRREKRDEEL